MSSVSSFCRAIVLVLCALSATARAADWPQWRGPERNGISPETGLLKDWPKEGPPLAWKATGLGKGFSSVAVVGGRIYTMGDLDDGSYVLCLDAKNEGKVLWKTKLGKTGEYGGYSGPRSTPTLVGDKLYALSQHGDLACLETKDGNKLWSKSLTKDFGGQTPGWGYAQSPLVDEGQVVVVPGGRKGTVLALDAASGEQRWRSDSLTGGDDPHYASPVPVTIGKTRQYLQLTSGSVSGIAPNGKLLWSAKRHGETAVVPDPVAKDNLVFVTSGYNVGCNLFTVSGGDAEEVYAKPEMAVHHGGVIVLGDYVYGASDPGFFTCMDLKTGKVVWKDRGPGKGAVTLADGRFYVRNESGPVTLVEATPDGYHQKGQFHQPNRSRANAWPHPAIADGKLYLRDQDVLLCYDVKAR